MGSPASKPKSAQSLLDLLVELDDPAEVVIEDAAPSTARPEYEPIIFAHEVESAEDRMTQPPTPTYDMLRDSCKSKIAVDAAIDEEQILRPSSKKQKITPR